MNVTYETDNIKSYRRHAKTHPNSKQDKTHKCNQCDFTYTRANSLKARLKKHSGVKRYECDYCDYASVQAGIDLSDGQFSERCDVNGSFFNSDAIPIIFGKA